MNYIVDRAFSKEAYEDERVVKSCIPQQTTELNTMRIHSVEIRNFRSICHLKLDLDPFVCVIGHNNAGKSTLLMALTLFRSGSAIKNTDFYVANEDALIKVTFKGVTNELLSELAPEHVDRISEIVRDGQLTLVRRYDVNGKSSLNCVQLLPKDEVKDPANIKASLKGVKGVSKLCEKLSEAYPNRTSDIEEAKPITQGAALQLAARFQSELSADDLEEREASLPTGIPASIEPLMPEILYIPAVKDLTDELKTKEASSFGKIIRVLLELVDDAEELAQIRNAFSQLDGMLNRVTQEDGKTDDNRLAEIQRIERRVEEFIREQFDSVDVEIEIPPPDLKTIFSSAKIYLNDGVKTDVESKGDGLKRAVLFALLRTLVSIQQERKTVGNISTARYLFLFEEPELYLHPNSQRVLYDALRQISDTHQVCVCTHSPYFFSASETGAYVRLKKVAANDGNPPKCVSLSVDLSKDLKFKDAFQIICFENSNAAFFSDRVLLVEGDCDVIYLKHLAKTLDAAWDFDRQNIAVVKVGGKGSFARYRKFFASFEVDVRIVTDLDTISDQFEKLSASADSMKLRSALIELVNRMDDASSQTQVTKSQAKDITKKRTFLERYDSCRDIAHRISTGESISADDLALFGSLFEEEVKLRRRRIIESDPSVDSAKQTLLASLREEGIVILSRGAIEAYYPENVEGEDKPTRAISACRAVYDRENAILLSDKVLANGGNEKTELELIFSCIFD